MKPRWNTDHHTTMTTSRNTSTPAAPHTIGFIGLGAMGAPIVHHLLSQAYDLVVFDLNPDALAAARQAGARVADSAAAVARHAHLVMMCLPSLPAIRAVLLGDNGVVDGVAAGGACRVLFDLSTTGPAFARDMHAALHEHGIAYLDAPITGNVKLAGRGRLGLMCSGASDAVAHARPALDAMAGTTVLYLGEQVGRAQTLKLLNNLVSACGMALTSEAFLIAVKAGVSATALLAALNNSEAHTNASRNKFGHSVLTRQFNYGARMAITAKDISLAVAEAEHLNVPLWVAPTVRQLWRYAASQGGAERDGSALITYFEPWAGVQVRGDESCAASDAKVHHVAPRADAAQRIRVIEDALAAALFAVACESYVTAVKAGLPVRAVARILGIESGRTEASARIFPQQVLTRRFAHGRSLGQAQHALEMLGRDAESLGISAWAINSARLLYRIAVGQLGADADMTTLVQLYETWAGAAVRDDDPTPEATV